MSTPTPTPADQSQSLMGNVCRTTSSTDVAEEYEASFQAREDEIERRKIAMREKVQSQLTRAEEETRRLAQVWEELEVLSDPMRKEVATVRKRIDLANRDLKSLGQICQKKEKEYKEAMEALQEKNNEKSQLTNTLVELVGQSEKLRMKKLEELSKFVNSDI
ncbi:uncharacterized protein LOC127241390 [Andrographis paniculata]|uniref:uncharacterized protein LOC127241390 n=1 Tax=Andrographis paniculata TaxID=175694 RepID=UPI0021E9A439|nr:uncharacterized protein LOC127241390 [Andrographis paniculata]